MAASEDALETYTHLALHVDPATKKISATSSDKSLQEALENINSLHQQFKTLETANHAPPPPVPVNPKRSAQIAKMRESATAAIKKQQYADAIRMFGLAIDMAASRPSWEPAGLLREELAITYMERSNANVLAQNWVEGYKDAECSTECKRGIQNGPQGQKMQGNPRAFVLGAKCLIEMSRWDEALAWLERGLELEGPEGPEGAEMVRLHGVVREQVEKRGIS